MQIEVLKSKLHRATVTDSQLNYEGSITIDSALLLAAGMREYEKVDIYNVTNGARFSTYIIKGGAGEICLNGAAARMAQKGDKIIIASYCWLSEKEANGWLPTVVLLEDGNKIKSAGKKKIEAGNVVSEKSENRGSFKESVLNMAKKGWSVEKIASAFHTSASEIELILEMGATGF